VNSQQKFILIVAALIALFLFIVLLNRELSEQEVPAAPTTVPTAPEKLPTPTATETPYVASTPTQPGTAIEPTPLVDQAREFYVSAQGREDGDGSISDPWTLQHALSHPEQLRPGDAIWVRGGAYEGQFVLNIHGEEGKPVIVRAYPGERAVLQHDDRVLDIADSSHVYLWGLEITATENKRDAYERRRSAYGVRVRQSEASHNIKFINMIVHDVAAQGFGWWPANSDSEIYGSIIYYNGSHNQFDHGIYVNNLDGSKRIIDNFVFDNASHGIHAYGEGDQQLNNITVEGNTVFNNGSIGYSTSHEMFGIYKRNILLGGHQTAQSPVVRENFTYYPGSDGAALNLGYRAGSDNAVVENNYFAGGTIELGGANEGMVLLKNTIIGSGSMLLSGLALQGNDLWLFRPFSDKIFVRPNQYEDGRANITVYNWRKLNAVTVRAEHLAGVKIRKGDRYVLRNVQDYFGDVTRGVYDGEKIEIPMTGRSVAQPLGLDFKPASTFPEFGAFVLIVETGN
jgi:hypothetical protein